MAQSIKLGNDTFLSISGTDGWCKADFPSNGDANDYYAGHQQGWYYIGDSTNMSNIPSSWGFLLVMVWGSITTQIFILHNGSIVKARGRSQNSWGNWKNIYPGDYEDVTVTCGSTLFNSMYYGDATPTKATRDKTTGMYVYNVANSRPVFPTWVSNTSMRIFSPTSGTQAVIRVYYTT